MSSFASSSPPEDSLGPAPHKAEVADATARTPVKPGATVMVIDDDDLVRSVISLTLRHAGFDVIGMSDGVQALAALERKRPVLIITDMLMPTGDGVETIVNVRRIAPTIPILAISGGGRYFESGDLLQTAKVLGVQAVLPKPFEAIELLAAVRNILAKSE
jgi:DNA-binding response OmpR family regulator